MHTLLDPQFGNKMVTLMAAFVLVLQIVAARMRTAFGSTDLDGLNRLRD